mgnify:CR=1 FL=1
MPPSDEGGGFADGEDGGRETREENISPPVFLQCKNPAPSSEGADGVHLTAPAVFAFAFRLGHDPDLRILSGIFQCCGWGAYVV